mmetsp:Transcript_17851/g.51982  ORF Transcript_17851/g.51982 Transcript_17851/m.51982 type:complete len:536 (+) Transcript_17851:2352-3959(+)
MDHQRAAPEVPDRPASALYQNHERGTVGRARRAQGIVRVAQPGRSRRRVAAAVEEHALCSVLHAHHCPGASQVWPPRFQRPLRVQPVGPLRLGAVHAKPPQRRGDQEAPRGLDSRKLHGLRGAVRRPHYRRLGQAPLQHVRLRVAHVSHSPARLLLLRVGQPALRHPHRQHKRYRDLPALHRVAPPNRQPRNLWPAHQRGPGVPHNADQARARDHSQRAAKGVCGQRRPHARGDRAQTSRGPPGKAPERLQTRRGQRPDQEHRWHEPPAQYLPKPGGGSAAEGDHRRAQDAHQPQARDCRHHRHVRGALADAGRTLHGARAGVLGKGVPARHAQHWAVVGEHSPAQRAAVNVAPEQPALCLLAHRLLQPSRLPHRQPPGGLPPPRQGELGPRRHGGRLRGPQIREGRAQAGARRGHLHLRPLPRWLQVGQGQGPAGGLGSQGAVRRTPCHPHQRSPCRQQAQQSERDLRVPPVQEPQAYGAELRDVHRSAHRGALQQVDPPRRLPPVQQGLGLGYARPPRRRRRCLHDAGCNALI